MPELPEVETLRLSLEKHILGEQVMEVNIRRNSLRYQLQDDLHLQILSGRILKLTRIAKYLILELDNDKCLIVHLGMSGRFTLQPNNYELKKHDHIALLLSNGTYLIFNDARRFGMIESTLTTSLKRHRFFKSLGPEPFDAGFNADYLYNKIHTRKIPVKNALMDNNIVVGIGNIYASESLFLAKIRPERLCNSLNHTEIERLIAAAKEVLKNAISQGGTTLKDFVSGDNKPGYFSQKLLVYGRAGKNCTNCNDIIVKIRQAGRASFYCPNCQK